MQGLTCRLTWVESHQLSSALSDEELLRVHFLYTILNSSLFALFLSSHTLDVCIIFIRKSWENIVSAFNVAKFGGTSVANFEAMSRCAAVIENNPDTRLVVSSACSGVTNLLVALANGVQDQEKRTELLQQLASIHDAILSQLKDSAQTSSEVYAILHREIASANVPREND